MKNYDNQILIVSSRNQFHWLSALMLTATVMFTPALNASTYIEPKGSYSVRIRTSPNGHVIGSLRPGGKVAVIGNSNRGWLQVKYQGRTAWIFKPLVATTGQHRPKREVQSETLVGQVDVKAASAEVAPTEPALTPFIPIPPIRPAIIKAREHHAPPAPPATPSVSEPDDKTTAAVCESCQQQSQNPLAQLGDAASQVAKKVTDTAQTVGKTVVVTPLETVKAWFTSAFESSQKPRKVADVCSRGHHGLVRGGNLSKCKCAQAAKEALINSGICHGPMNGNAIDLYDNGVIANQCPNLQEAEGLSKPEQAPIPSLIVYRGYAGAVRHNYGHIEAKVMINGKIKYCSDFCSDHPTLSRRGTNHVVGIFVLK